MALSAFVIGGTGLIGAATARRLAERGFEVTAAARGTVEPPEWLSEVARVVELDRTDDEAFRKAFQDGYDVLVDTAAYRVEDAEQLVGLAGRIGSLVVLSSAAVYADAAGRSFEDASGVGDFPDFPVPISERQPTVEPADTGYAPRKVAIERAVLAVDELRATVVRPGAVYGPHDARPREWYFVKRALDRRPYVVLAFRGESRFHPTAVENLAELLRLAAERPERQVLNCADPEAPTVLDIGRAIGKALGHDPAELLLPGPPVDGVGDHPWGTPKPFVLDTTDAEITIGWRPVTRYERAARATCEWLVERTQGRDWHEALPGMAKYYGAMFDYEAEDRFAAGLRSLDG
jgi:nucleoside-diphosphate-sugar epimerase